MIPQRIKTTVKHGGGNIQVWGVFYPHWCWLPLLNQLHTGHGEIAFHFSETYCTVGRETDSKHTSKLCMNYLKAKAVIEFPPQPPDLNPTHYLQGDLKPDKTKHSWHEVLWSVVRSCERICAVGGKAVECKRINSLMNNKNSASLNDNNNNNNDQ